MNKTSRTTLVYIAALAALIMVGVMLTSPTNGSTRIEYDKLLELIAKDIAQGSSAKGSGIDVVSIRGTTLIGRYENSRIAQSDYPSRYDFETTIGSDFITTVRTMGTFMPRKRSPSPYCPGPVLKNRDRLAACASSASTVMASINLFIQYYIALFLRCVALAIGI